MWIYSTFTTLQYLPTRMLLLSSKCKTAYITFIVQFMSIQLYLNLRTLSLKTHVSEMVTTLTSCKHELVLLDADLHFDS